MDAFSQRCLRMLRDPIGVIRSNRVAAGVVLALVVAASCLDHALPARPGAAAGRGFAAVSAALRDPLAYLLARSPGPRDSAGLMQTKQRAASGVRSPAAGKKPHERVLAGVRYGPAVAPGLVPDLVGGPLADPYPGLLPVDSRNPAGQSTDAAGAGGSPSAADTGFLSTGSKTSTGTKTPSAVPEPSTWSTMISGMALVGAGLRRCRRKAGASSRRGDPMCG